MIPELAPPAPLDALVVYVASALADEAVGRLTFAASEAARIVELGGATRTTAVTRLVLAAQYARIGLHDAENILREAFDGGTP